MIVKDETINRVKPYLLLTVLVLGIFAFLTKLWKYDFKIPMGGIDGDTTLSLFTVKNIADHGWYLNNENLAAPFGLEFYDFPMIEGFHFLLIKIINFLFSSQDYSYVIAFNIYFILGFIFASITTYLVAQKIKLPISISIIISLLYSFQPYHFWRSTAGHYYLSAYYLIPISLLIIIWLINEEVFFGCDHKIKFDWKNNKSIACFVLCLMISSSGAYYAIFTCFFVLIIAFIGFYKRRNLATLFNPLIVISTISFGFFINLVPNFIYWFKEGRNLQVAARTPLAADIYSLKISQMLLPTQNHRFPLLSWLRQQYDQGFPMNQNEGGYASLGIFGSIGFLLLLGLPFVYLLHTNRRKYMSIFSYLSILTYATIFLAQTGGFGSLINLYITPQIRAYNRISIFVSLFALLSFGFLVAKLLKRAKLNTKIICCSLILVLGIYDQVPILSTDYNIPKNMFIDDKNFVAQIENQVANQSMIYQLPYMFFPENPNQFSLDSYGLLRGYFHSNTLRWSFGSLKGRNRNWHPWVNGLKLDEQLAVLSSVGFQGIYVDTNGYDKNGRELEELKNNLQYKLNVEPTISPRQDLLFYNMKNYNSLYQEKYPNFEKDLWLYPSALNINFGKGFHESESSPDMEWRWSSDNSIIDVTNITDTPQELNLEITLQTTWAEKSELKIASDLWTENFLISSQPLTLRKKLSVPSGKHRLKLYSNARQVDAPLDSRRMFFKIINSKFENPENQRRVNLLKKVSQELSESMKLSK